MIRLPPIAWTARLGALCAMICCVVLFIGAGRAGASGISCPAGAVTWTNGGSDGNWFDPANWSGGAVPTAATTACIDTTVTGGTVLIESGAGASAASVTSAEPALLAGGSTLTLSGSDHNTSIFSKLTIDHGATLTGAASAQIASSLVWDGGATIQLGGTLMIASSASATIDSASDASAKTLNTNVDLAGAATYSGTGELFLGGTLDVQSAATFTFDTTTGLGYNAVNGGAVIHVESGGKLACDANGTEAVVAGVLNQGVVTLGSGCELDLDLGSAGGTDTGSFSVPSGARLAFGSFGEASPQSTFDPLQATGGGTVEFRAGFTTNTIEGTTTIPAGMTLQMDDTTLNGSGTLDIDGTLQWDAGGTLGGTPAGPTVNIAKNATFDLDSTVDANTKTLEANVNLLGTAADSGGAVNNSGTFDVQSGAKLTLGTTAAFDGGTLDIDSAGTVQCTASGTESTNAGVLNHGTVALDPGCSLDIENGSAGGQDTGAFDVPPGSTLAFGSCCDESPQTTFAPLDVVGGGTLQFAGGFTTDSIDAPSTLAANTTLQLDGGSTLNGTSTLTVDGSMLWDGGSTYGGDLDTTVAATGSLTIDSAADATGAIHQLSGGTLTVDGAGTLSGVDPLAIGAGGELDVAHGATFTVDNFQQLSSSPQGVLLNDGVLDIPSGDGGTFGSVTNAADGTIENGGELISTGTFTEAGSASGNPIVVHNGTLAFTGGGSSSFYMSGDDDLSGAIAGDQAISLLSDATDGNVSVSTTGNVSNAGTITFSAATSAAQTELLQLASGSMLTNTSTGAIDVLAQPNGSPQINLLGGTLDNRGSMTLDQDTTIHSGTLSNEGTLRLNAKLMLDGDFSQSAAGTLAVALLAPSDSGALALSFGGDTASLAGTLAPAPDPSYQPIATQTFPIITSAAGETTGTFAHVSPAGSANGLQYVPSYATGGSGVTLGYSGTAIDATGGSQSAQLGAPFAGRLVAYVANAGGPVAGAPVTFTAPAAGASGMFPGGAMSATVLTDANGDAKAPPFTANATAGTYAVSAATPSASVSASFPLQNVAGVVTWSSVSTNDLSFGGVLTGTSAPAQTVTLTNDGGGPLFVSGTALLGSQAAYFAITDDGCSGVSVAPGGTCAITVSFAPASVGASGAQLSITSDAPDSPQLIALSGTGTTAETVVSAASSTTTVTAAATTVTQTSAVTVASTAGLPATTTTTTTSTSTSTTHSAAAGSSVTTTLASELGLPAAGACVRSLSIDLHAPARAKLAQVTIRVDGHVVRTLYFTARRPPNPDVTLGRLPAGTFTIKLDVRLNGGRTVAASRTYRRCAHG